MEGRERVGESEIRAGGMGVRRDMQVENAPRFDNDNANAGENCVMIYGG